MGSGAGVVEWFHDANVSRLNSSAEILKCDVTKSDGTLVSSNFVPFATPGRMDLPAAKVHVKAARSADGGFIAEVTAETLAMYVTLTTLAHGRFEDNAFLLHPPGRAVMFWP